jgi:hypothetical protein
MDRETHHYDWSHVPRHHRTEKQLLKRHRRLKKTADPVGTITLVFDKARSRPRGVEAVPPEECEQIRKKLARFGTDASDQWDLYRLDRAGQLVTLNLYDLGGTEPITSFTEKEAQRLLGYMVWDHSHEDHYITEANADGERMRATWKSEFSAPDLSAHLSGDRYFGVKKGRMTIQVTVDCDRHGGGVPGDDHAARVLEIGRVLTKRFPQMRFAPEINPRNGSVKFFGWLRDFMAIPLAEKVGERVRQTLQEELPGYDFSRIEIYPSSSPQIFAPLRADKTTVVGGGPVPMIDKYRLPKGSNGKRRRRYYQAHSCAAYLDWVYFSDEDYDEPAFEKLLREAVARCPDRPAAEPKPTPAKKKAKSTSPGGMGDIGKLKGRCASDLVNFWSELNKPEDDTVGKYVIVTLRVLKHEGLTRDEAVDWVEERLQALKYTEFSDRLTDDFAELQRVTAYAVEAVWENNGYQKDPALSDVKLKAAVEAWSRRGFKLHHTTTWEKHKVAVVPNLKLVWTAEPLSVIPELAALAHTSNEQAKVFIEKVLAFFEGNNELAESMVGRLLEECGVKGRSRQKQYDVRKFLVEKGLLIKQRNYFCDKVSGYRHGNFYVCGPGVRFGGSVSHTPPPVSICYPSLTEEVDDLTSEEWLDLVMEGRRLACDGRYRERLRRLNMPFARAA